MFYICYNLDTHATGSTIANGFTENSNYETHHGIPTEFGRGKRKATKPVRFEESESDEDEVKGKDVAAPPPVPLPFTSKASSHKAKVVMKVSNQVKSKKSVKAAASAAAKKKVEAPVILTKAERVNQLKQKIIAERQKAVGKQQDRSIAQNFKAPSPFKLGRFVKSPVKITVVSSSPSKSANSSPRTPVKSPQKMSLVRQSSLSRLSPKSSENSPQKTPRMSPSKKLSPRPSASISKSSSPKVKGLKGGSFSVSLIEDENANFEENPFQDLMADPYDEMLQGGNDGQSLMGSQITTVS